MMITHAESPAAGTVSKEWQSNIMHARLQLGDRFLMASDAPPDYFQPAKGFHVQIGVTDTAEAERLFNALAAHGKITMPLQETFWAARFGMLVDQYDIPWMIKRIASRSSSRHWAGCRSFYFTSLRRARGKGARFDRIGQSDSEASHATDIKPYRVAAAGWTRYHREQGQSGHSSSLVWLARYGHAATIRNSTRCSAARPSARPPIA
jgi:PhnB protein